MGSCLLKGSFRASIETDIRSCYTPGASNIAVAGKWTRIEAVFPIKNGDIPASYVSLPDRMLDLSWQLDPKFQQ